MENLIQSIEFLAYVAALGLLYVGLLRLVGR